MSIFNKYEKSDIIPLAVLIAVYIVSAAMLFMQYRTTKEQLTRDFRREKTVAARFAAKELAEFLEHEQAALTNIAGLIALTGSLEKGKPSLETFMASHKRKPRFYSFKVLDSRGRFVYSAPEDLEGRYMQDLSGEEAFRNTRNSRKFFNAGAVSEKGEWALVMAAPVLSKDGGGLLGIVSEKILMQEVAGKFIHPVDSGKGGYAFLLDESGRLLASQRGGRLYQVEGSSDTLRRMLNGEEGAITRESAETGREELTVFSPVKFSGRVWTVGIVTPPTELYGEARKSLQRTMLIISLITLVFSWSLVSVARSRKYKAGILERTRLSEYLMGRNRELSALNDFSSTISASEDLDGLIEKALNIIVAGAGARGGAVRLLSNPDRQLYLKNEVGMPDEFSGRGPCSGAEGCECRKAMSDGRPVFLRGSGQPGSKGCDFGGDGVLAITPLIVKKKALGVLYLWEKEDISQDDRINFLTAFGNQLAANIENVLQMEDTKRHSARASALFNTAQALTRGLAMDDLLEIIMKEAAALLKVQRSLLLLYREEENLIDCRVALGFTGMPSCGLAFNPSGVFWEAMRDGGVKTVDLAERGQLVPRRFVENIKMEKFILVPLLSKGKVLGFIVLESAEKGRAGLEDLKMIMGFANQAAIAIETSSFYIRTVEKYNQDLQDLSSRIIAAQEEERKRISRDLHDELGQALTAIKINLDMISSSIPPDFEQLRSRISDAVSLASATLVSVRRLSFELRPSMLDDLGLVTVLGRLVADFKERTGIDIDFAHDGMPERLSQEIEVTLYRVVQEALTNIMKHSKAGRVSIVLGHEEDRGIVSLKVEDDGAGIPERDDKDIKGFGLMGIRERVSLLGGNFRIFSQPGSGTKIFIDIPYSKGEMRTWTKA